MTHSAGGTSIQDRYFSGMTCFGCGPANARGLQLKSFDGADGEVFATFLPWPEHDNGLGYLNGGIISTLLDCHSAAAMVVESAARGLPADGTLHYVTAQLDVRYLRPAPLTESVQLRAQVVDASDEALQIDAQLWWEDKPRATARAVWRRWRPRPRADTR